MKFSPGTALIVLLVTLVHVVVIAAVSPLALEPSLIDFTSGNSDSLSDDALALNDPGTESLVNAGEAPRISDETSVSNDLDGGGATTEDSTKTAAGGHADSGPREEVARQPLNQGEFAKRIKSPELNRILNRGNGSETNENKKIPVSEAATKLTPPVNRGLREITPISGI